jgi:hypothetical protein
MSGVIPLQVVINTADHFEIDWGARGYEAIVQNVMTLINTQIYEVAYDRLLGLPGKFLGRPLPEAIAIAAAEIYDVISSHESRATVRDVEFTGVDDDGNLQFRVVIEI